MSTRVTSVPTLTIILLSTLAAACRDQPSPLDPTVAVDMWAPTVLGPSSAEAGDGTVTTEAVLSYGAPGYRYLIGQPGHTPGFEEVSFDASSWPVGDAPFGLAGHPCELNSTIRTPWPVGTDLLVRKSFDLPAGATRIRVAVAIDNDIEGVYLNGMPIGDDFPWRWEGCAARDSRVREVDVSELGLQTGPTVLAVRAHDYGVATYFDIQVDVTVEPAVVCDCEHEDVTEGVPEGDVDFTAARELLKVPLRGLDDSSARLVRRYQDQMNMYAGLDEVLVDGPIDNRYISFGSVWNEVEITTGVLFHAYSRAIEEERELRPAERLDMEGAFENFYEFRARVRSGRQTLSELEGLLNDQRRARWFRGFEADLREARKHGCTDRSVIDEIDVFVDLFRKDADRFYIDLWGGKVGDWATKLVDAADWALWMLDSLDLLHPFCGPINRRIEENSPSFFVLLEAQAAIHSLRERYELWLECLDDCLKELDRARSLYERHARSLR